MNTRWWTACRAALRIARRDARRHKARSALVIAMVGLPMLGVTAADVLTHSANLTPLENTYRDFGNADALVRFVGPQVEQSPDGDFTVVPSENPTSPPTTAQIQALAPQGARVVPWVNGLSAAVRLGDNAPVEVFNGQALDYTDPAASGLFSQREGQPPRTDDELELTPTLARRLGAHVGSTVTLDVDGANTEPHSFVVAGIVARHYQPDAMMFVVRPGALSSDTQPEPQFLVTSPHTLSWHDVRAANAAGAVLVARSVVENPPPKSDVPYYATISRGPTISSTAAATIGVVVVMCLLEIVFLAGPAFAVGARNQRRQLGLVVASGGEPRDAGAVVLGGGVVLGVAGGVAGIVLGIGAGLVVRHVLIGRGRDFGGLHLHPWEIVGAGAIGLLVGLLAAAWPARVAARHNVVDALAGRRPAVRSPKRISILGLLAVGVGVALTAYGALHDPESADVAYGSAIAELGLAACTPALIGLAARLAHRAPLATRLALRDNGRNRGRAAPAVAAIMAAVAGTVAIGIYASSSNVANARAYLPLLRHGQADLPVGDSASAGEALALARTAASALPVRGVAVVENLDTCAGSGTCTTAQVVIPESKHCLPDGAYCGPGNIGPSLGQVLVGGPNLLRAIVGHDDPDADAVLESGGAVVFDQRYLDDGGRVAVQTMRHDSSSGANSDGGGGTFRAVYVASDAATQAVLSPAAADELGVTPSVSAVLFDTTRIPTHAEEAKADKLLADAGTRSTLYVERGYHAQLPLVLVILVIAAAIVTIGAAGAATGLAIADAKLDHETLTAVGASPATRRRLAMASAATVGFIGALLGAATGFVPALGVLRSRQTQVSRVLGFHGSGGFGGGLAFPGVAISIPWVAIVLVVVAVPAMSALCAGAFTRSQRALDRRVL